MIKAFSNGILDSNVYVYSNNGEAIIIDCGVPAHVVERYVNENMLNVKYIVLTHGHFDHVAFVNEYLKVFSAAKILCGEAELDVLYDEEANLSSYFADGTSYNLPYTTVKQGDTIAVGNEKFTVITSPGHTPGSICLYCDNEKIMFTGDVLFDNSYGRTDFKYGNFEEMVKTLKLLLKKAEDVVIYPGHYGVSSIGKNRNLFF